MKCTYIYLILIWMRYFYWKYFIDLSQKFIPIKGLFREELLYAFFQASREFKTA